MPVRNRRSKRRVGANAPEWEMVFLTGNDYFDDLADAGINIEDGRRPPMNVIEAAWRKHGRAFLTVYHDHHSVPWAVEEFGQP